jgi:hypothetical protein
MGRHSHDSATKKRKSLWRRSGLFAGSKAKSSTLANQEGATPIARETRCSTKGKRAAGAPVIVPTPVPVPKPAPLARSATTWLPMRNTRTHSRNKLTRITNCVQTHHTAFP